MIWGKLVTVVDNESKQEWKVYEYRYIGPWTDSIKAIWGEKEILLYYRGITEMSLSARHNDHGSGCRKILSDKKYKGEKNIFHRTMIASGGLQNSSGQKLWDLKVVNRFFYYYRNTPKFDIKYISVKEAENMGVLNTKVAPGLNNYPIDLVYDEKSEIEYVHQILEKEKLTLALTPIHKKDPLKSKYKYVYSITNPGAKKWHTSASILVGCYFSQEGAALAVARFKAESSDAN